MRSSTVIRAGIDTTARYSSKNTDVEEVPSALYAGRYFEQM